MSIYEPGAGAGQSLRIMLLCSAFSGVTQRVWLALREQGHHVTVQLALGDTIIREAAATFAPDLILCPYLKERVPHDVHEQFTTIIISPGRPGACGPNSLDWAVLEGEEQWGVTAFEASDVLGGGPVWSAALYDTDFNVRKGVLATSSAADAALACAAAVITRFPEYRAGLWRPEPQESVPFTCRVPMRARTVHLEMDSPEDAFVKILASDGEPGAPVRFRNLPGEYLAFDAHLESAGPQLMPGEVGAWRDDAVLVGAVGGNLWIGHLKDRRGVKLPATQVLGEYLGTELKWPLSPQAEADSLTYQPITYRREGRIGTLAWSVYNGAMSTAHVRRLQAALAYAAADDTDVLVLMGASDAFSTGIHLGVIEAAPAPAREAWENVNALNDLIFDLLNLPGKVVVTALSGSARASGVSLGLAGDVVLAREGIVLNPHEGGMGLYGSGFWTRLLPGRVGASCARELTDACLPVSARMAERIGLVDAVLPRDWGQFRTEVRAWATRFVQLEQLTAQLRLKAERREYLDAMKPLTAHRAEELAQLSGNLFQDDCGFDQARRQFVQKVKPTRTPRGVAVHRLHPEDADSNVAAD